MRYDAIIVGGGIVGLATGLQLLRAQPTRRVLLLEKEAALALHQTGNNSGVIHSGLYYKPGSLKAKNCISGYKQLLEFCQEMGIPYEITGKVVVATQQEQLPLMRGLLARGLENGLTGSRQITLDELKEREPYCAGVGALFIPQTGIVDYHRVALAFGEKFQALGGEILLQHAVTAVKTDSEGVTVRAAGLDFKAKLLINCAGLYTDKIAEKEMGERPDVRIIPFRGEYYKLKKEREYLVNNLIYPIPDPNFPFLGVHFTRMMKGGVEAGPNAVLAFRREGYTKGAVHLQELAETLSWPGFQKVAKKYWKTGLGELYRSFSKAAFTEALQALIPDVQESDLVAGGAGVRAQACDRSGGLLDDFAIRESRSAVHVLNAPSQQLPAP
ncbi:FAD dependent oxidoreductase [Nitritalea halalkaliphila LW7]|uniref:FAD dependent oxidoreductase n=1 Tax=Nitritalea halalkaliphila LW7 TaxID=1189621 RepID=I5BZK6_9BACT|nr:FAD dependent oxidoreductase [Nitritalea halalkaliphila LW7]